MPTMFTIAGKPSTKSASVLVLCICLTGNLNFKLFHHVELLRDLFSLELI